ncbi:MAG: metal-responsive CopG/Arc/MetJ family transcriptional regulator [Planctomycetota bacterium]|jgi:metal-responsive CopG/Arc/MetJ family transcriptional regulator
MFGSNNKVKLDKDLLDRIEKIAEVAGYASRDEFIQHVLEREVAQFEDAGSDDDITAKLKGLGYIS